MKVIYIIEDMLLIALAVICLTDSIFASESNEGFLPQRVLRFQRDFQDIEEPTLSGGKANRIAKCRTTAIFDCEHYFCADRCGPKQCNCPCNVTCESNCDTPHGYAWAWAYAECKRKFLFWWKKKVDVDADVDYDCDTPGYALAFAYARSDPEPVEGGEESFAASQADFPQTLKGDGDAWVDSVSFTAEQDTLTDSLFTLVLKGGPLGTRSTTTYLNQYSRLLVAVTDSVAIDTLYWGYVELINTAGSGCSDWAVGGYLDSSDFDFQCDGTVSTLTIPDSIVVVISCPYTGLNVDCIYEGWVWHDSIPPTFVELSSFTATGYNGYVEVNWTTETEIDNAGFNLHRGLSKEGPYAPLNEALIPAQGDELQGATYSFTDRDVTSGVTYYYWLEDVNLHARSTMHGPVSATPTSVEEREEAPVPTVYSLAQNYPNPFNATTLIRYSLPAVSSQRSAVSLRVYNLLGQEIRNLVDEEQAPGYYSVSWDGRDSWGKKISSGIYLYQLRAGGYKETRKTVHLR